MSCRQADKTDRPGNGNIGEIAFSDVASQHNLLCRSSGAWCKSQIQITPAKDDEYEHNIVTARCTLVQSAVLRSHVVCLSVCDVGEL